MLDTFLPGRLKTRWLRYRIRQTNREFADTFTVPPEGEFISLDLETSSIDPETAEILEMAAVPIRGGRIFPGQSLELRVKPSGELHPDSVPIHQIREKDLENALPPEEALRQLLHFIGSRPLIGYNIRFDQQILSRLCRQYFGFTLPNPVKELSRRYYWKKLHQKPEGVTDLRLESICRDLSIPMLDRHTARGDALTVALAWLKLE
ncbi:MAG: 3'-5' exonuclease [Endozoicomonas sp.]